jgi:hypothetical protein
LGGLIVRWQESHLEHSRSGRLFLRNKAIRVRAKQFNAFRSGLLT